jgi:hypothetical protein
VKSGAKKEVSNLSLYSKQPFNLTGIIVVFVMFMVGVFAVVGIGFTIVHLLR